MHIRTSHLWSLVFAVLLAAPALAHAQSFPGSFPRPLAPSTYTATGAPCSIPASTRAFTDYQFNVATAGSYTFTITRRTGTGLRLDLFQPSFAPATPCTNQVTGVTSATATAALTSNLTVPGPYTLIIAGGSAGDTATFDVAVTGPDRLQPICTNSTVVPNTQLLVVAAGAPEMTVITPATGCWFWNTSNVPAWIPNFPASGAGPTTVNYSVATNPTTSARSQTIAVNYESRDAMGLNPQAGVGSTTLMVSQVAAAATCTFTLSAMSASPGNGGGNANFMLTANPGTCVWTADSNVPWITAVTASGTGSHTINYTVAANVGPPRTGTITVAGLTFTVNQADGCTFTIAPTTSTPTAAGGPLTFTVTASANTCPWTATTGSAFVSGLTASGTGTGPVNFTLAANPGPQRVVTITAAGKTYTATQANGCAFTLSPTSAADDGVGGMHSFMLNASAPTCPWTASDNANWISGEAASGTGSATITYTTLQNLGASRVGIVTAGGQMFTVTQQNGCGFALNPTSVNLAASSGGGLFMVTAQIAACTWTASTATPWISNVTAGGTGSGTVSFGTTTNTGPARVGTITAAGITFTVNQGDGCSYTLSATSSSPSAAGGAGSVMLTASTATCMWTATSNAAWITGVTASGTGNGTVNFAVAANPGPARSGTITIGGNTYTVNQAAGCSFTLSPTSAAPGGAGGAAMFMLTASSAACTWTASTTDLFITGVTASGTGSGVINYTVSPNAGATRTGTITAGGQTFTVTQTNGCGYSLSAASGSVSAAGQSSTVFVTASSPSCAWTASTSDSWIMGLTMSGTGSGLVSFNAAPTTGPARTGTITIAGLTFTVTQASGCVFTLTPDPVDLTAAGDMPTVTVTTSNAACAWTATSTDPWITGLTGAATGDGMINFTVAANPAAPRMGSIDVSGQTLPVNQAGGCTITLGAMSAMVATTGEMQSVTVMTSDPTCTWSATSTDSWLSGLTASGTGNGMVAFTAAANTGVSRTGTISIGGQTFTVTQDGGCTITLTPTGETVPSAGSQLTFLLMASDQSCTWTAGSTDGWLTGVLPASGTGNGAISYSAGANLGVSRTGTITAGGQTFTVMQPGVVVMPIITRQPAGETVQSGATIQLTVEAVGGSLTYQWQKDGMNIPGATMPTLTITGASPGDAGSYTVIVTNAAGMSTSDPAAVVVTAASPDGGPGADGGGGDAGKPVDGGKTGGSGGGCGCATGGSSPSLPGWQLGLLGLGLVLARRRRSR